MSAECWPADKQQQAAAVCHNRALHLHTVRRGVTLRICCYQDQKDAPVKLPEQWARSSEAECVQKLGRMLTLEQARGPRSQ